MANYTVNGMTCQGCANAVKRAIETAAPQTKVTVDLASKRVTVEGKADTATISRAVTDAGFEFAGPAA